MARGRQVKTRRNFSGQNRVDQGSSSAKLIPRHVADLGRGVRSGSAALGDQTRGDSPPTPFIIAVTGERRFEKRDKEDRRNPECGERNRGFARE